MEEGKPIEITDANFEQEVLESAIKYGIMSIPVLNINKNGKVVDRVVGVTPSYESDLKKKNRAAFTREQGVILK